MARSRKMPRAIEVLVAAVLVLVIALVWIMALREDERRGLLAEYEAFRASAGLAEELRRDPEAVLSEDTRILGYGLYDLSGAAVRRMGSAPERLDALPDLEPYSGEAESAAFPGGIDTRISDKGKSYILYRFLGPQSVARGMMQQGTGSGSGRGMGMGWRWQTMPGQTVPGQVLPGQSSVDGQGSLPSTAGQAGQAVTGQAGQAGQAYQLWMEYDVAGALAERTLDIVVAIAVTLVVVALYLVLLSLFRRNERFRDREAATRELIQLGEAARTLVHEIKNPLGILRIQNAGIRKKAADLSTGTDAAASGATIVESTGLVDREISRLADLADRIREFLKTGNGTVEQVDLGEFVAGFAARYAMLGHSDGLTLSLPEHCAGAFVRIDPERLTLALDNLVRNAREANAEAGKADTPVRLSLARKGKEWVIAVSDSGKGIPPEDAPRIFEPFFTTKEKGSGIGLALAKRIAENAGGDLKFESIRQSGSVFEFSLPAARDGKAGVVHI